LNSYLALLAAMGIPDSSDEVMDACRVLVKTLRCPVAVEGPFLRRVSRARDEWWAVLCQWDAANVCGDLVRVRLGNDVWCWAHPDHFSAKLDEDEGAATIANITPGSEDEGDLSVALNELENVQTSDQLALSTVNINAGEPSRETSAIEEVHRNSGAGEVTATTTVQVQSDSASKRGGQQSTLVGNQHSNSCCVVS